MDGGIINTADMVWRSHSYSHSVLSDPEPWLVEWATGGRNASGEIVNRNTSTTIAAVYRAVSLIGNYVAKLPCVVYQRVQPEGKEADKAHPAYKLCKRRPTPDCNAFVFFRDGTGNVLLNGNSYAYVRSDQAGDVQEMWLLDPEHTYPVRENGRLWIVVHDEEAEYDGEQWKRLDPRKVLHLKGLGYDGLVGYSVIEKAADTFGEHLASRKYASVYFRNSATPKLVLEVPGKLPDKSLESLRRAWETLHTGSANHHKTAILEGGVTAKPLSISNRDSQLLEQRQYSTREIATWFGLPPHKLGDTTRVGYNSLEMENQALLDDAVDPWLVQWEMELMDKLLRPEEIEADSHLIEFTRQALVRADMGSRSNYYNTMLMNGTLSRDEVRAMENKNPIPGGYGKEFYQPINMGIAGQGQPQSDVDTVRAAWASDIIGRVRSRLENAATRSKGKPEEFLESVESKHLDTVADMVSGICSNSGADPRGVALKILEDTRSLVSSQSYNFDGVEQSWRDAITQAM